MAHPIVSKIDRLGKRQRISDFDFDPALSVEVYARVASTTGTLVFNVLCCTGVFYGLSVWAPSLKRILTTSPCSKFSNATHVWVRSNLGPRDLIKLEPCSLDTNKLNYYGVYFLVDKEADCLVPIESMDRFSNDRTYQRALFGSNKVKLFLDKPLTLILAQALFTPTIIFGLLVMFLWVQKYGNSQLKVLFIYVFNLLVSVTLNIREQLKSKWLSQKNSVTGLNGVFKTASQQRTNNGAADDKFSGHELYRATTLSSSSRACSLPMPYLYRARPWLTSQCYRGNRSPFQRCHP